MVFLFVTLAVCLSAVLGFSEEQEDPLRYRLENYGITPKPAPIVIVHSYTGRTALVGREIARMLGGRFFSFSNSPDDHSALPLRGADGVVDLPPKFSEVLKSFSSDEVRDIYLGFPIWGNAPSFHMVAFVDAVDLKGKRVILFYTYIQSVSTESIREFQRRIRSLGAECPKPLSFRFDFSAHHGKIIARTRSAVFARGDLWNFALASTPAKPSCVPHPSRPKTRLCRVPAGKAWVGEPRFIDKVPGEPQPRLLEVGAFEIDQAEVTIAEYLRCEQEGFCHQIELRDHCAFLTRNNQSLPIPCVSYDAAEDFCEWIGMRLPTLAEWTRAARGDSLDPHPWGHEFSLTGELGNFGESSPGKSSVKTRELRSVPIVSDGYERLAPGCSFPKGNSRFGVCDMAGNLAEWVHVDNDFNNNLGVLVGGTCMDMEADAFRVTSTLLWPRKEEFFITGFRCAR